MGLRGSMEKLVSKHYPSKGPLKSTWALFENSLCFSVASKGDFGRTNHIFSFLLMAYVPAPLYYRYLLYPLDCTPHPVHFQQELQSEFPVQLDGVRLAERQAAQAKE